MMLIMRFCLIFFMAQCLMYAADENYAYSAGKNPYSVLPIEGESKLPHKKRKKHKVLQHEDGDRQLSANGSTEQSLSDREDEAYQSDGASVADDSSDEVFENVSQDSEVPDDVESESAPAEACVAPSISEAKEYFASRLADLGKMAVQKTQEKLYDPAFQRKIVNQLLKRYVQVVGLVCSRLGYIDPGLYEKVWFQYNTGEFLNQFLPE